MCSYNFVSLYESSYTFYTFAHLKRRILLKIIKLNYYKSFYLQNMLIYKICLIKKYLNLFYK